MGAQTMGSQGGGTQEPKSPALGRQSSLYSLTLEEVQNHLGYLGKPLSSMNLDELLKSVWTAEANQAVGMGGIDNAVTPPPGELGPASSLHRQASLTLSRDLSKKTVDEVWRDIQQGQQKNNNQERRKAQETQPTLGEMTLEDFLVKAGVVAESPPGKKNDAPVLAPQHNNVSQHAQWMPYQLSMQQQPQQQQPQNIMTVFIPGHPVQQPVPVSASSILDAAYPETQMTMSPSPLMGTLSDTQTPGRKRVAPGDVVEKTVERRQKRMIKNRESAARSRARRQAYTHELENKVSRLEEENERLKKQKHNKNDEHIFKVVLQFRMVLNDIKED
ncbi:hypothetical protein L1049_001712 [Liquidambar formosana]|uniref:BZIP domain-containing protein n=1 Tax=Liquidambar formosana TaxID=63359 RepID=A0AAP0R1P2_LIQFO